MLFQPEHVEPIRSGDKDRTRRLWKKPRVRVGSIHKAKLRMLSPDTFALIRITDLWQEPLSAITDEEARHEGGYTREAFLDLFRRIYGLAPDDDPEVWVVGFRAVRPMDEDFEMLVQKNARLMEMLAR